MILTHDEIKALTGRVRFAAQRRALFAMMIRYVVRPDGSPVVTKAAVDEALGVVKIEAREPELRL